MSNTVSGQNRNAGLIAVAAVLLVALGAAGYYFTKIKPAQDAGAAIATAEPAAGGQQAIASANNTSDNPGAPSKLPEIKPGNPVVAKVDGQDVPRADVLNFIQSLPPQTRQVPLEQLYPMAVDQVINAKIIGEKTKGVNLDADPQVKEQLAAAKEQIVRAVYLQNMIQKQVTDEKLKAAYDAYVKNFPDVQEVKASHILVKDKAKAEDIIKKLEGGGDFAALAKENSTDATAQSGGDLGYFTKTDVVPEFAKAAFVIDPGTYSKEPVKTQFGYHVIKVYEKRQRPPATFENAKPLVEAEVRREILNNILQNWRKTAKIEKFDINGEVASKAAATEPATGN